MILMLKDNGRNKPVLLSGRTKKSIFDYFCAKYNIKQEIYPIDIYYRSSISEFLSVHASNYSYNNISEMLSCFMQTCLTMEANDRGLDVYKDLLKLIAEIENS